MSLSIRFLRHPHIRRFIHPNLTRANSPRHHNVSSVGKLAMLAERVNSSKTPPAIHTTYPALLAEFNEARQISPIPPPLNQEQLVSILEKLASSARPADLQRIDQILSEMSPVFGIDPSIEIYTTIVRALAKHGNTMTVHRWLLNMPLRPGHFSPTLEHFHIFLEACVATASFKFMRNLVLSMRQSGCKPTNETFKLLIDARWSMGAQDDKVPHLIVFNTIVEDMKREGLRHDPAVAKALYDGYASRGFLAYAEQIQAAYRLHVPDSQSPREHQQTLWNVKLSGVAQTHGLKAAIATFRDLEKEGCKASASTTKAILRHSRSLDDIKLLETELGFRATVAHYSIILSNNVRSGEHSQALVVYQEAKKAGVPTDAALVAPLIKALCRTTVRPPTESAIDQALALYHDLAETAPLAAASPKRTLAEHSIGPDADIYQSLLRGLASTANLEKYFPIAKTLMDDMESRGIAVTDSITASSIIILLMRQSPNRAEALSIYQRLSSCLDEKGYAVVLNAFCRLSFADDQLQVPSLNDYFSIVRDMRHRGLTITAEVYTILLQQLAVAATQIKYGDDEATFHLRDRLILTTRRTHDLLTLDAAVSPDAHVWNQLMDTYQRLGCFGDSYRVWDMMYLSGRFDHISVSIILDACGYAGAWQIAKNICAKLFKDGYEFDEHNWNTWLECLCRLGRLNDAVKIACMEMGKGEITVAPDADSIRILIKFARRANQYAEVAYRLQRYLPELWSTLPAELKTS